jgi:hypothetical protein
MREYDQALAEYQKVLDAVNRETSDIQNSMRAPIWKVRGAMMLSVSS